MGRSIRAVVLATVFTGVVVGGIPAAQAGESRIVEDTIDAVRARVCVEEYGYGVINCSETIDPLVEEAFRPVAPVVTKVVNTAGAAIDTVQWAVEEGPGIVEDEVHYVYCWMVQPENPDC